MGNNRGSAIDTARVRRRQLRFSSIEDALAEVDRIIAADQAGTLRAVGNWTPGQAMGHVAAWIDYAYDGFPIPPAPWFVRWILRWNLTRYLRNGMPPGAHIPGVENGTAGTDVYSLAEGSERLRRALLRLKSDEQPRHESPGFGAMSRENGIQLNLRHAELHLSFLEY